jgi:hypothetical protein
VLIYPVAPTCAYPVVVIVRTLVTGNGMPLLKKSVSLIDISYACCVPKSEINDLRDSYSPVVKSPDVASNRF